MKIFGCNDSRHVRPLWTAEEMGLDYELEMLPFPPRFFKKEYLGTEEEIDELTSKIQKVHQEEAEEEKKEEEQDAELKRLERLFKTKLDIFNVKEIFESDDKESKSKIRRSKSEVEALMYAVVLMIEEKNKNN